MGALTFVVGSLVFVVSIGNLVIAVSLGNLTKAIKDQTEILRRK